jgi:hypothetical protein
MKKILLIAILSGFTLKGQSIKETISFINEAIQESTKSAMDWSHLDKIKVNEKGKLITDVYMDLSLPEFTLFESRSVYLKNLTYSETKYFKLPDGTNHYVIILKCSNGSNCVSVQVKGEAQFESINETTLTLYNEALSAKVKNAIIHLIDLAKSNSDYLTKDPF